MAALLKLHVAEPELRAEGTYWPWGWPAPTVPPPANLRGCVFCFAAGGVLTGFDPIGVRSYFNFSYQVGGRGMECVRTMGCL